MNSLTLEYLEYLAFAPWCTDFLGRTFYSENPSSENHVVLLSFF